MNFYFPDGNAVDHRIAGDDITADNLADHFNDVVHLHILIRTGEHLDRDRSGPVCHDILGPVQDLEMHPFHHSFDPNRFCRPYSRLINLIRSGLCLCLIHGCNIGILAPAHVIKGNGDDKQHEQAGNQQISWDLTSGLNTDQKIKKC